MEMQTIVLNSEYVFRNYVLANLKKICEIVVFEDSLDHAIFFYCFTEDEIIVSSKELNNLNFNYFKNIYINITAKKSFSVISHTTKELFIKTTNKNKKRFI